MRSRTVLSAFLASPSDLADERRVAQEVVSRINSVFSDAGLQVDLFGWEDTLPGYSRPQELINPEIDKCDLFIGVLWKRWGLSTGAFSSGFEEEFTRARARRLETGRPEIWLFFKEIDSNSLADPGEQLRRVMDFRAAQERGKELLFSRFQNANDWEKRLHDHLLRHLLAVARETSEPAASSPPSEIATESTTAIEPAAEEAHASAQLRSVFQSFESQLPPNSAAPFAVSSGGISRFSAARLSLFAKSWMSSVYSHETLGIHDVNLLYQSRDLLSPLVPELTMILRTLVADRENASPGWFWLQALRADLSRNLLAWLASEDANETVRLEAISMLRKLRLHPRSFAYGSDFLEKLLTDPLPNVAAAAQAYVAAVGTAKDLGYLTRHSQSYGAFNATLYLLAKFNPGRAMQVLIAGVPPTSAVLSMLRKKADRIPVAVLERALASTSSQLRHLALDQLHARDLLTKEQEERALADSSLAVRAKAYEFLIQRGERFAREDIKASVYTLHGSSLTDSLADMTSTRIDPDDIVRLQFASLSREELVQAVRWLSPEGHIAYAVLAERHFGEFGDQVRQDLRNGFARVKQEWEQELIRLLREGAIKAIEDAASVDDFIRDRYIRAALLGLAVNGNREEDRPLALPFVDSSNILVKVAAAKALGRLGIAADAPRLINAARQLWANDRFEVALLAARLGNNEQVGGALLASGDPEFARAALVGVSSNYLDKLHEVMDGLLADAQPLVRKYVLAYLVGRRSRSFLVKLLARYLGKESYYYDIVTWLDRILYAQAPFRRYYRRTLLESLLPPEAL